MGQMGTGEVKSQVRMSGHITAAGLNWAGASEDPPEGPTADVQLVLSHTPGSGSTWSPEQATGPAVWLSPWDTKIP